MNIKNKAAITKAKRNKLSQKDSSTLSVSSPITINTLTNNLTGNISLVEPWCTQFIFDPNLLRIPKKLLFSDYLCRKPQKVVNVAGWRLSNHFFYVLGNECKQLKSIILDDAIGVNAERLENLRGISTLNLISLKNVIVFDQFIGRIISSLPSLTNLDISGCNVEARAFQSISQTCSSLKILTCHACPGLDDLVLLDIADLIGRFRNLFHIDLSNNSYFTDEGVLAIAVAGPNIIKSMTLHGCRGLSTLSIAGLRKKMTALISLDISNLNLSVSAFEWINEGCHSLQNLDLSKSAELDDASLTLIGKKCKSLEKLILTKCTKISDNGIIGFFREFEGNLKKFDLSGCVLCGSESALALSTKSTELTELRLSGLSQISSDGLKSLWIACRKLVKFEMAAELRSISSHRRSMVPHMSDDILKSSNYHSLKEVKLTGACLVTDIGACAISLKCPQLTILDVGYCNGITDKLLVVLGSTSFQLTTLVVSGCNKIGDVGLTALCTGCKLLTKLEAAGCARITDIGVIAVTKLKRLEVFNIRGCDHVTDKSIRILAQRCIHLKSVDVNNLDMVSLESIGLLTQTCRELTALNCSSCNLTPYEFHSVTRMTVPLAQPAPSKCNLEARPRDICEYNRYVLQLLDKERSLLVIQKFARKVTGRRWRRQLKVLYHRSCTIIQKCFRGQQGRKRFAHYLAKQKREYSQATHLQKCMRKLFGMRYANIKRQERVAERSAAILIQRIFRGHASRKRSVIRYRRRCYFDQCLVVLARKSLLLYYAKRLRSYVILIQRTIRSYLEKIRYQALRSSTIILQACFRCFLTARRSFREAQRKVKALAALKRQAVLKIRAFWNNRIFNRRIIQFVADCAHYYSIKWEQQSWLATKIQAAFRGFHRRLLAVRAFNLAFYRQRSAVRIQCAWKRSKSIRMYHKMRKYMKAIAARWRHIYKGIMKIYYGHFATIIQKLVRNFLFRISRTWGALEIQRVYRGYVGRCEYRVARLQLQDMLVKRIQRQLRLKLGRKWRFEIMTKELLAAKVIQRAARRFIGLKALRRRNALLQAQENAAREKEKKEALLARKQRAVDNIYRAIRDRYAMKIQRTWRNHKAVLDAKQQAQATRQALLEEAKDEIKPLGNRLMARAADPFKRAFRGIRNIGKHDDDDELFEPSELPIIENSILKHQTLSIEQAGVVDIHLTVGGPESAAFGQRQKFLKGTQKPYFVKADGGDLSGNLALEIFLWTKFGSGVECICSLKSYEKSKQMSLQALNENAKNLLARGVKVAWHERLAVEFHGICLLKQGKAGYALDGIRVCRNLGECERADAEGYRIVQDMSEHFLPTSVWAHNKKEVPPFKYPHSKKMLLQDWFDERLDNCIQMYNLHEDTVFELREVFDRIQGWADNELLRTESLFRYMGINWMAMCAMVVGAVNPINIDSLRFSEYVHLVCAVCMLGKSEMQRMIFKQFDPNDKYKLSEESFSDVIDFLTEGLAGQQNLRKFKRMYNDFLDPDTLAITLTKFQEFMDRNPRLIWSFSNIQVQFMRVHLGEAYWLKKMHQFKAKRDELGVVTLK